MREGLLAMDVGWVGDLESTMPVDDDQWHHVAITFAQATGARALSAVHGTATIYVDGEPVHSGEWGTSGTANDGDNR